MIFLSTQRLISSDFAIARQLFVASPHFLTDTPSQKSIARHISCQSFKNCLANFFYQNYLLEIDGVVQNVAVSGRRG